MTDRDTEGGDGEFDIIRRHFKALAAESPGALGLGDDGALLDVPPGRQLAVTTDALVAGVHFLDTLSPADIAYKVTGANLSDLAAMGARPRAVFLAVQLTDDIDEAWLTAFAEGLAAALKGSGATLMGGDLVTTPGPLALTMTAIGEVVQGRALTRAGARAGDSLFVTGTIGDGALGLMAWQGKLGETADWVDLKRRYARPEPRHAFAAAVADGELAHACIDVSDGLAADVGHICEASSLAAEINASDVPLSDQAHMALQAEPGLLNQVLGGGDDYELVLAVPPEHTEAIVALADDHGLALTRIGALSRGVSGVTVLDETGAPLDLGPGGYRHR